MDTTQVGPGTIVVGIDGSPDADNALNWALRQADLERRPLSVVHCIDPVRLPPAGAYSATGIDYGAIADGNWLAANDVINAATTLARDAYPQLEVHGVLSNRDPRSTLLDLSGEAAMLVVGSRGRGPIASLLLGSVSVAVSKHAACPVVVVRPPDPAHTTAHTSAGILVGVDGTPRSEPAVEFAYRMASFRGRPLTVLHCSWDGMAITPGPLRASAEDLDLERERLTTSLAGLSEKYPDVSVTVQIIRAYADRELADASRSHDLVILGHRVATALDDVVYGSLASSVVEHSHGAVAVVPTFSTP